MSLLRVPAVASACRRPMRVCNRSAGYPLRSAAWNWCSAAADLVLMPPRVALPAVRNRVLGCSNYMVDQVELSGLEPLTSCMPCRPISSAQIPGSLVPARQAKCSVWLGPVLTARVWGRSHLVCHWLSGPHQGGETPDKQRQHRQPHTLPHQRPGDRDSRTRPCPSAGIRPGLANRPPQDDHRIWAGDQPWLTVSSGSPPP
jgi:hypothetical protein